MTTSYASLDAAIVKAIREGNSTTIDMNDAIYREHPEFDFQDRLLAIRRENLYQRGIIEYNNGRWSAVEAK